ncbi:TonB system transport protein ExbD [Rhodobacter capsulatus]|jgi:biopolymer transport protein ExbD|uniref:Biopolymer transport protein ExbD n=1 Tax=Rhodobacter capsulatus (strain ATCC BAA-309 / NBRC 16581 / SB1003) TaxID=272942 RepID=D5ALP5_RHOCB|nr:TonB system transport protein ExbD [Rhodobacter capsulatus]ADE86106.1 biopolymer transport protein ExbD-1 [Rhodobacter capsulatus SB 1003]ETD01186.1 biopolymer transporter [Rhodobacter capsulatus DE442]ETD75770.1 biopolymer transporter [Rhodobacter capsulatus R121]ETD79964.1 biopolymer transporter [Rhodobacter capsulatus B6]ETD84079.1 biopolymer transporter [Rhodobacter capsulatus YW1]
MAVRLSDGEDLTPEAAINITPFIDVMLVLLIIFMVAAPLSTVDVPLDLPVASGQPQPRPPEPVVLSLSAEKGLMLGRDPVSATDLPARLAEATQGDLATRIFVSADKSVPYGEMMGLLNQLRAGGYLKIGLVGLEEAAP